MCSKLYGFHYTELRVHDLQTASLLLLAFFLLSVDEILAADKRVKSPFSLAG